MPDKKYQVFISSTYKDLIDARLTVAKSILDLGHIPAAMEYFPAMDEDQLHYIKRIIDQCDYYVLIIAGKYGSMDSEGISYTEREYEYALEKKKFVLGFIYHNINSLPRDKTETDNDIIEKVELFRSKVMKGRLVRTWNDDKDLNVKVITALSIAFSEFPQEGWVRSPKKSNELLLEELNNIRKENENLRNEIDTVKSGYITNISNLVPLDSTYVLMLSNESDRFSTIIPIEISWRKIFLIIAKYLCPADERGSLRTLLSRDLCKLYNIAGNYTISLEQFDVILSQFQAYKIIETRNRSIYMITKAGEDLYLDSTVIKIK